jgi:hypothetical protein
MMRYLIALPSALLLLCAQGCSSDPTKLLAPTPLSVALTVGEWILKDNKQVFVVDVEATAHSAESARKEAFKLAVSKALGSLVVVEREINNNNIIRDEFLTYSSGYVEDYLIKSESQQGSLFKVVATVSVSKSKIADRLRASNIASNKVDGEKLQNKIETYTNQAASSDKIIENLIKDFPHKSFQIDVGKYSSRIKERQLEISVPYRISWDQAYLLAIEEALVRTREGSDPLDGKYARLPSVISIKKKGDWFKTFAAFPDRIKEEIFYKYMIASKPLLMVQMRDSNDDLVYRECFEMPHLSGQFHADSIGFGIYMSDRLYLIGGQFFAANTVDASFGIFGDYEYENTGIFGFNPEDVMLSRVSRIEMNVIKKSECEN